MAKKVYDVAIVGCGPAGMFCALELKKLNPRISIVMFDRGNLRDLGDDNLTSGWGGAGAFSDGKLTLSHRVGGQVSDFIGEAEFYKLMEYVRSHYVGFGGNDDVEEPDPVSVEGIRRSTLLYGLELVPYRVHHFGSDNAWKIVKNLHNNLRDNGVEIRLSSCVDDIVPAGVNLWKVVAGRKVFWAKNVFAAAGREGEEWWVGVAKKLGLRLINNGVDIGVRVEVRDEILDHLTKHLHDLKLIYRTSSDDKVRTFCVCPSGFVKMERYRGGLLTVNGYSNKDELRKSRNTNFALLTTMFFTEPFNDPISYGKYVSGLANLLSGGSVLVQRLADLKRKRRSKPERIANSLVTPTLKEAVPGDLRLAIPERQMQNIMEMIDVMAKLAPGLDGGDTLLYGTEVKFYSEQVEIRENFETRLAGLYVGGDASGWTRGLMQSSMTGIIAARDIASKQGR